MDQSVGKCQPNRACQNVHIWASGDVNNANWTAPLYRTSIGLLKTAHAHTRAHIFNTPYVSFLGLVLDKDNSFVRIAYSFWLGSHSRARLINKCKNMIKAIE